MTERADLARSLIAWFRREHRDLPWRPSPIHAPRDAYRVLVSEIMLQQTQASRVAERYGPFLDRFPAVDALASADEQDVLAMWSGLGYYRRARSLHAAAQAVVEKHDGVFPTTATELRALPGVGDYTAGAIASLVSNEPAPAVDGNVTRVLLRVHGKDAAADDKGIPAWARSEAAALHEASSSRANPKPKRTHAMLNEALIELGATVCTPRAPKCLLCPIAEHCQAAKQGRQDEIPRPKKPPKRRVLHAASVVVRDGRRVLVHRRPADAGLWAGLWQVPTVETDQQLTGSAVAAAFGLRDDPTPTESFAFQTTHRDVRFAVWQAAGRPKPMPAGSRWVRAADFDDLALSTPQRRILNGAMDSGD